MSAHLSTTGPSSQPTAWHELEEVFAELGHLARSPVEPHEFYRTLVNECVRALAGAGGVVWLRSGNSFEPIAQLNWPGADLSRNSEARRSHDALLADAAARGAATSVAAHAADLKDGGGNPTDFVLLLGPVNAPATNESTATLAIIELLLEPKASPSTYRGYEQFLTSVCELAADYHSFAELRRLRSDDVYRDHLLQFSTEVHRHLSVRDVAYAVANEGRRVIGCDRLSVLVARGSNSRLLAASGVSRAERRSGAVRRIEELAELVRRSDEPASYDDARTDALPPITEALEQHAEESHARQIAAVPLRRPADPHTDESKTTGGQRSPKRDRPQFVLVAEQFDAGAGELHRERLTEIATVCATALYNAQQVDRLPLVGLLRPLGAAKHWLATHTARAAVAVAALVAGVAALIFVPADFRVESPGTLQPVVRRDVFAPRGGLVDEVLVAHGADVVAGQPLVRLHDPVLDLELKRVDGELETAQRQLDSVRAMRTNRQVRDPDPAATYRLSAEDRELQQKLTNLRRERELLMSDRETLVVTSPISGRVLSWDIDHRLSARPVERGEVLVTVADLSADWQLELAVPDDRIGYVLAAQQELQPDLAVQFRLSSDDRQQFTGHIAELSRTADVDTSTTTTAPSPTVLVKVAFEKSQLGTSQIGELRPGVSARAQIECGRRALGYVWLHDIWDAALEWVRF